MQENIEDFLHHRSPHIFVDSVIDCSEHAILTEFTVRQDLDLLKGHFPGAPILPGSVMQEICTQSAGILIAQKHNPMDSFNTHDPHHNKQALGVLRSVKRAKYKSFAKPGDVLFASITLEEKEQGLFHFKGSIKNQDHKKIMSIEFALCNIASSLLQ